MTETASKKPAYSREKIIRPSARPAESLPVQVSLPLLAKLLGISLVAAREHVDKRLLVKGNGRELILEASVQSYCAHLRKLADGSGGEHAIGAATAARARLMDEQATLTRAKSAKLASELVEADAAEAKWTAVCRSIRARVMTVADRMRDRPHRQHVKLATELRSALSDLADG